MAFLDKFNEWYIRAIPETGSPGPFVSWMEPVAGSRYRWKRQRSTYLLIMAGIFLFMLLPLPGRHQLEPPPLEKRVFLSVMVTGLISLLGWGSSHTSVRILLTGQAIFIGSGRSMRRIPLDTTRKLTWEEWDGHRVLVLTETSGAQERIYLDLSHENEVRELLAKAGQLKIS